MAYTANVYKAKDVSAPLPEYDAMRSRLAQKTNADTGQQQDAMARRFAAQGGSNTGAAIKQQQLVAESGAQRQDEGNEQINAQEAGARRQMQQAEDQKVFQSQEAEQGRQFAGNESQLGREHARGMFDDNMKFEDKWKTIGQSNTIRQLDQADRQLNNADREYQTNLDLGLAGMDDDQRAAYGDYSSMGGMSAHDKNEARASAKARAEQEANSKKTGWNWGW